MENKNNFKELLDILLGRGLSYGEIRRSLQEKIILEHKKTNPSSKKEISFILNENNGSFSFYEDGRLLDDQDFLEKCEIIIQKELLSKAQETENLVQPQNGSKGDAKNKSLFSKIIFSFYTLIFFVANVVFLLLLLFSENDRQSIMDFFMKDKAKIVVAFLFFLIPILSSFLAFKRSGEQKRIFDDKKQLSYLLFLFELPTFFLLLIFLISFQDVTPFHLFFVLLLFVSLFSIPLKIFKEMRTSFNLEFLSHALNVLSFLTFTYLASCYFFVFPPIISGVFQMVVETVTESFESLSSLVYFFGLSLPGSFILFIFLILIVSPFLLVIHLYKSFLQSFSSLQNIKGWDFAWKTTLIFVSFYLVVFSSSGYQKKPGEYLLKLENFNKKISFEEKENLTKEIIQNKEDIQKEIKTIEKAKQRYFFSKNDRQIQNFYEETLDLGDTINSALNEAFLTLAYPFVYRGTFDDFGNARRNYQYLIGVEIRDDGSERNQIENERKNVGLLSRNYEIKTDYNGLLSETTLTDTFINNKNTNQEEVIYEFYLPEGSVVTKLSLGPNLEFPGIIAKRGAANKVYDREVRQAKDPAVLEEISPDKYRLRVFPIPIYKAKQPEGSPQKVSFTYVSPLTENGYSLPKYFLKENLSMDETSIQASIDGKPVYLAADASFLKKEGQEIDLCNLNENLKLKTENNFFSSQIVPWKNVSEISEKIGCKNEKGFYFKEAPSGLRVALLYDSSLSNKDDSFVKKLKESFQKDPTLFAKNEFDLYFFNDSLSQKTTLKNVSDFKEPVYFTQSLPVTALKNLKEKYDLIILASSSKKFEKGEENTELEIDTPIYLIADEKINVPNLPKNLSYLFNKKRGAVLPDLESALNRFMMVEKSSFSNKNLFVYFGPFWGVELLGDEKTILNTEKLAYLGEKENDSLNYFTSKRHFLKLVNSSGENLSFGKLNSNSVSQYENINKFHDYAKANHIVTPFSSLISLVNKNQKKSLEKEEENTDSFSYEKEESMPIWETRGWDTDFSSMPHRSISINNPMHLSDYPMAPSSSLRGGSLGLISGNSILPFFILLILVTPIGIFLLSKIVIFIKEKIKRN